MYTTKSSAKNVAGESHLNVWEKYRPANTINFSDIVEDRTIYDQTRTEATFDSLEISSRSSAWDNEQPTNDRYIDPDAVTVDDILGQSTVHEIRHLSQTQRVGNTLSTSRLPNNNDFSYASVDFRPAEEMQDQLKKDEKEWDQEYADIPNMHSDTMSMTASETSHKQPPRMHGRLANMTDFSMAYVGDSISGNTDTSIGRYFSNRCQDIREIIPNSSPTKHIPIALVSNSYQTVNGAVDDQSQASSSFYADDESNTKAVPKISTATYDKERSIISLSSIASNLEEIDTDSPRTFLNKLYSNKPKPLTEANVRKLEESTYQPEDNKLTETKAALNQDHLNQMETDQKGMLDRMNSTKFEEQENQWRQTNSGISGETTESLEDGQDLTLDSICSPIKSSSVNGGNGNIRSKAKRLLSPNSTKHSSPQKENAENIYNRNIQKPQQQRSPAKGPLDDVSSILLNKLQINSSNCKISKSPVQVRESKTEMISSMGDRRFEHRFASTECVKYSLPCYGLSTIRSSYQDGVTVDKRCNSQLSTHSEFTQNDGKFPLKSNTSELIWECVKLRKSVSKSFVIKNTSEKKLSLKVGVIGPGFQITSGAVADILLLQGNECRTINVSFCPTIIGKAAGKVIFRPTRNWPEETERSVHLWAYGGSTVLQLQNVERGPVGSAFLKMGETSNLQSTTLTRTFCIYNKGPLNGVATIFLKPKTNQYISETHIVIQPNKCAIRPDCFAKILVSYKLRRKDLERLKEKSCEVLTIGTLEVIFGAEPNRQRIASMLTRKGKIPSMFQQLNFLIDDFPVASNENFKDFREHESNVSDLFGCFKTSEIALTINHDTLDDSRDADLSGMDESVLFRTLIETPGCTASQSSSDSSNEIDVIKKILTVEPKRLSMDTKENYRRTIRIKNQSLRTQTFQLDLRNRTYMEYLNFSTTSGQIKPDGEFKIDIEIKRNSYIQSFNTAFTVYVESDSIEVPLRVSVDPE